MNNRKGFTLTELLAVIVILSIIMLLAVPNVLELYNSSRVGSFVDEARNIYNAIQPSYQSDFLNESIKASRYCESEEGTIRALQIKRPDNLYYDVQIGEDGKITKFHVVKGQFAIILDSESVLVSDIIADVVEDETDKVISCN